MILFEITGEFRDIDILLNLLRKTASITVIKLN